MNQGQYVFSQLVSHLDRNHFNYLARKYGGNKYVKHFCLVAIVHHDMKLERSTYEVLQILSISLTNKTHLTDLFDKTKFNDVKELDCPLFPGLFD